MSIIAQVIEKHGYYSASLERAYITSQQRQPDPELVGLPRHRPKNGTTAEAVLTFLRQNDRPRRAWSHKQLAESIGRCRDTTSDYVRALVKQGLMEQVRTNNSSHHGPTTLYRLTYEGAR